MIQLVLCTLDDRRYGLLLTSVERVLRAVEITALSEQQARILGVINMQGQIIPVANLRRWLHLPERDIDLSSRMIVVREQRRSLVVVVDSVPGIATFPNESLVLRDQIGSDLEVALGVVKMDGDMLPVIDIARLFTAQVEPALADGTLE